MPRPCEGKQTFTDYDDANRAAARTRARGYGKTMRAYRCRCCDSWHIGHARGSSKYVHPKSRRK